jgi:hypothetical protein
LGDFGEFPSTKESLSGTLSGCRPVQEAEVDLLVRGGAGEPVGGREEGVCADVVQGSTLQNSISVENFSDIF